MGFYVNLDALSKLMLLLCRLEEHAAEGQRYVTKHTELDYGPGLLNKVRGGHTKAVTELSTFLGTLSHDVAGKTADAVARTGGSYRRGDEESAAALDAAYGKTPASISHAGTAYSERYAGVPHFSDVQDPTETYREPRDYHGKYPHRPELSDAVSPASTGRDAIWWATQLLAEAGLLDRAYDPYESWVKPLSGDWAGLRACVDIFTNTAVAVERMGDNVLHAALALPAAWGGNAADACQAHLASIKNALYASGAPLRWLATEYHSAADGAAKLGKTLGSLLSDLLDAALIFAIEVAAAGATSETVIGAIIFGGAAVYEGKIIVDLVREALDLYGRASALMDSVNASAKDFGVVEIGQPLPQLPTAMPERWA